MGRRKEIPNEIVVTLRVNSEDYELVREIAALETNLRGKYTSAHELIRDAIRFVYKDNERMRECFRRSRSSVYWRKL